MRNKIKLFWYGDSPETNTGFGIVNHNVLKRLYKTGRYDIFVYAINHPKNLNKTYKEYTILPVPSPQNDPFGLNDFDMALKSYEPDVIVLSNDVYIIGGAIGKFRDSMIGVAREIRPNAGIFTYFPIDGNGFNPFWGKEVIEKVDVAATLSKFAVDVVKRSYGKTIDHIYHGIDTSVFKPMEKKAIEEQKKKNGWADKFVIVNVNKFQPRKDIDLTLRAMDLFRNGHRICHNCGNYYPARLDSCDLNFCGKYSDGEDKYVAGVKDAVIYLHMNKMDPYSMGRTQADTLDAHIITMGMPDTKDYIFSPANDVYSGAYSEKDVNTIYNLADVFMTTTHGEGFGLTAAEAMAAGTRVIAPQNSTHYELFNGRGRLVENAGFFSMGRDSVPLRQTVNINRLVDALHQEYKDWVDNGRQKIMNDEGVKFVKHTLDWDVVARKFDELIRKAMSKVGGVRINWIR